MTSASMNRPWECFQQALDIFRKIKGRRGEGQALSDSGKNRWCAV